MKKNRMTRNEKRRLLLKKQARRNPYLNDSETAVSLFSSISWKLFIISLAMIFAVSGIVSVMVRANPFDNNGDEIDGITYQNATELVFGDNKKCTLSSGLVQNAWYRYESDGNTYVFQAEEDVTAGKTISLNENNNVVIPVDPAAGTHNLLDYTDDPVTNNDGTLSFSLLNYSINDSGDIYISSETDSEGNITYTYGEPESLVLKPEETYYYYDDTEKKYYYITLKPESEVSYPENKFNSNGNGIGYYYGETREKGVYHQMTKGDLAITLNKDSGEWSVGDNYYTRHVIYRRANSFQENHVYLVSAINGSDEYLLNYGDSRNWSTLFDNDTNHMFGGGSCHNLHFTDYAGAVAHDAAHGFPLYQPHVPGKYGGEYIYKYYLNKDNPLSNGTYWYEGINGWSQITFTNYYDGLDGTLTNDPYMNNMYYEFSSYTDASMLSWIRNVATSIIGFRREFHALRAFDGDGSSNYYGNEEYADGQHGDTVDATVDTSGYYTNLKSLGSIYSVNSDAAATIMIHKGCFRDLHSNGNMWSYSGNATTPGTLKNSNAQAAPVYLNVKSFSPGVKDPLEAKNLVSGLFSNVTQFFLYEMVDVYDRNPFSTASTVLEENSYYTINSTKVVDSHITVEANGIPSNNDVSVTFTLMDNSDVNSQQPLTGYWSGYEFDQNGTYTIVIPAGNTPETSFDFTNIPEGAVLTATVNLTGQLNGTDNPEFFTVTIDSEETIGPESMVLDNDNSTGNSIVINYDYANKIKTATIRNDTTYEGETDFSDPEKEFSVTFSLMKPVTDENNQTIYVPASNVIYKGTDDSGRPTTYSFDENGSITLTPGLKDDQYVTIDIPNNWQLTIQSETEENSYYSTSYSIDNSDPDSFGTDISDRQSVMDDPHTFYIKHSIYLPPVTGKGETNDSNFMFVVRIALVTTAAAGVIYIIFRKRKSALEA